MSSTVDLSGIEVVDADRRFIRQAHKDVELQAHKMLEQGIEAQVWLSLSMSSCYVHIYQYRYFPASTTVRFLSTPDRYANPA